MKRNMDEIMNNNINKEQVIPDSIRVAFDKSYEQIRQQSKKKVKKSWLKPVSAAAVAITLSFAILLTNDTTLAKLQAFLSINDPGIETAVNNGDLQYIAQTQKSENLSITLENLFVDAYRLGLQVTIEADHISKDNLNYLSFEYRLFDANGIEIDALVSDTKEIAGSRIYSGADFQLREVKNNSATLEFFAEATTTTAPSLEGAKLVVETVHFINNEGGVTSVDGEWTFDLTSANVITKEYVAKNSVSGLTLEHAIVTNGSMQLRYKIDGIVENENEIFETALINDKGESFFAKSANVERLEKGQQTVISLVFPYSVWNKQQSLLLKVKGYNELRLVENE